MSLKPGKLYKWSSFDALYLCLEVKKEKTVMYKLKTGDIFNQNNYDLEYFIEVPGQ